MTAVGEKRHGSYDEGDGEFHAEIGQIERRDDEQRSAEFERHGA